MAAQAPITICETAALAIPICLSDVGNPFGTQTNPQVNFQNIVLPYPTQEADQEKQLLFGLGHFATADLAVSIRDHRRSLSACLVRQARPRLAIA
jgi:hypothetical protein